jgi:uncharacterized membrane-anchored protein
MNRALTLGVVVAAQAALVAVGVAPQLSARISGEEYTFRVEPVDPIDPFRGAYVTLGYPDLRHDGSTGDGFGQGSLDDGERGAVYITLAEEDGHSVAREWLRDRPDSGPYLACDDSDWQIRCGIESWFLPQDEAAEMERVLREGAVAEVLIDSRGNAALVDVRAE